MTALLGLATRLGLARLLLMTGTRSGDGDLEEFIDACFAGGVDMVQLRDPAATADQLLAALQVMRSVGYRYQGLVSVYDSTSLAQRFGTDLLHLSAHGEKAARARRHLHQYALIGRSCHSVAEIDAAVADPDVNYFTAGPVFEPSGTGRDGLDLVRHATAVASPGDPEAKPWFAITGITVDNLDDVLAAGARRIAVSRAITEADDHEAAAHALKERLRKAWNEDPVMADLTLKMFRPRPFG